MSTSLVFEFDPIDQPFATDPVERLTWGALRIRAAQRFVSVVWDRSIESERKNLYVPGFPIAEWLAQNWWTILNEPCISEAVPRAFQIKTQLEWVKRHCLRAADSALMLPAFYVFHDGRNLRAEWYADAPSMMPNMPGEFVAEGSMSFDAAATQESLAGFINDMLARVASVDDERVRDLKSLWNAIQSADIDEQDFCAMAGRMGIDPYDPSEMTDSLADFFERSLAVGHLQLVRDLAEVASAESIKEQWTWLSEARGELELGPNPAQFAAIAEPEWELSPPQFGYRLAREVRSAAGVQPVTPLESLEAVAGSVIGSRFRLESRNHIPGDGVRLLVGRSRGGDIVATGPLPPRADNRRFLCARSLYHALVTTRESERLVTEAFSWDQKASRAFAAELLAPQQALVERCSDAAMDVDLIERISREFEVSTIVVEKQLENAGIALGYG